MEERFLYTVYPKIPIKNLRGMNIRRPRNIELTIEEVKMCLRHGPVKRNFVNGGALVPVTLANLEQLHVSRYNASTVVNPDASRDFPVEETFAESTPVEEKVEEVVETPVVEEVKEEAPTEVTEETPVIEETVKETETVEEKVEEVVETPAVEEKVETPVVEEVKEVVEEKTSAPTPKKSNNRKKK